VLALQYVRGQTPTITEFCNCARNEIDKLDSYKDLLGCTLWPDDNYWRTFTLYQRASQSCTIRKVPKYPELAKDTMDIYYVKNSKDDGNEDSDRDVKLGKSVLVADVSMPTIAIRYTNLNIPRGATIYGAYMGLQPSEHAGDMNSTIITVSVEQSENSPALREVRENISSRLMEPSAYTILNVGVVMPDPAANLMFQNVQPQLEAVTRKQNWQRGNAMTLLLDFKSGSPLMVYAEDQTEANHIGPILLINIKDVPGPDVPGPPEAAIQGGGSGLSSGAKFVIVLVVLVLVAAGAYGLNYYWKNKTLFTSFRQDSQFQAFTEDEGLETQYSPPEETTVTGQAL